MNSFHGGVFILAACLLLSASASPAVPLSAPENLIVEGIPAIPQTVVESADRYTNFRSAAISDWHPIDREMLIATRFADTAQLHLVSSPGGCRRQLTFYNDRVGAGIFPPREGRYFVFSKDQGGDEFFQKYRFDLATRDAVLLTDGRSRNTGGVFSNRGDILAYTSTRRDGKNNDIYVVDPLKPESDRLLVQVSGQGWSARDFSVDDTMLLIAETISINESYLWLADVATGKLTRLTPKVEGRMSSYHNALFARDGKGVYATTDNSSEFQTLKYIDLKNGRELSLTPHINWDVEEIALSDDGKWLAFVANEDGYGRLHLMDLQTRKAVPIEGLPGGQVRRLAWHRNSEDLAFSVESARSPSDVYSLNVKNSKIERWTFSETGQINAENFSEPELVRWKSFDGRMIPGFLYRPPARFKGPRPVMVIIHGGPEGQARPGFLGRLNHYLNDLGIAILFPNVRGSSGYGKSYLKLDNGYLRLDSYKDINALFDWIEANDDLNADRIMITGGSYGGHMTLAIATHYPERFRCAVDIVGMSNLVTFLERTQDYRRDLRRVEYGDERDAKMRAFLEEIAPLNRVDKIARPLFVIQGENDPRVPASEARQIVDKASCGGNPVWYLSAKDEGHGFAKKKNSDFQFYATVLFVEKFLLDAAESDKRSPDKRDLSDAVRSAN